MVLLISPTLFLSIIVKDPTWMTEPFGFETPINHQSSLHNKNLESYITFVGPPTTRSSSLLFIIPHIKHVNSLAIAVTALLPLIPLQMRR